MNLDVDKKFATKSVLTVFPLKFIHSIKTLFSANAIWKQKEVSEISLKLKRKTST